MEDGPNRKSAARVDSTNMEGLSSIGSAIGGLGGRGLPDSELSLGSGLDQTKKKKQKLSLLASRCCRICSSLRLMRTSRSSRAQ